MKILTNCHNLLRNRLHRPICVIRKCIPHRVKVWRDCPHIISSFPLSPIPIRGCLAFVNFTLLRGRVVSDATGVELFFLSLSRISDTSENKPERLDSDNQINISRLISFYSDSFGQWNRLTSKILWRGQTCSRGWRWQTCSLRLKVESQSLFITTGNHTPSTTPTHVSTMCVRVSFLNTHTHVKPRGKLVNRNTKTKTTNLNLAQGTKVDDLRTATSYFDKGWNAFVHQKDGSIQWILEQIVELVRIFTVRWYMGTDPKSTGIC